MKAVLDSCSGSRMMWLDKADPRVIFGDIRHETRTVADRTRGKQDGTRTLHIHPDRMMDFCALPYADGSFKLIAFDPPHLIRAGSKSWLAAKYGKLSDNWQEVIRAGFSECWRVLDSEGKLVFKWNETQIKLSEILPLAPARQLFGQISGAKGLTHWLVFYKEAKYSDNRRNQTTRSAS